MAAAGVFKLRAPFLRARSGRPLDVTVPNSVHPTTGLTVWSLYGMTAAPRRPCSGIRRHRLRHPGRGCALYTYLTTLVYSWRRRAQRVEVMVLDRPNP